MWAGALAMKASLRELAVGGDEAFFVFGEVFGEALAFGGDVDVAFVEDGVQSKSGRARVLLPYEWARGELDGGSRGPCGRAFPDLAWLARRSNCWRGVPDGAWTSFSGTPSSLRRARIVVIRSCNSYIASTVGGPRGSRRLVGSGSGRWILLVGRCCRGRARSLR